MEKIVKKLRKSRKKWTVMARPKKKPEPPKNDRVLLIISVLAVLGAVFLNVLYEEATNNSNKRAQVFAEQIKSHDDLLMKRKATIDSLQNEISSSSIALMKEQEKVLSLKTIFAEKEKDYRETIVWLRTEIEKRQKTIEKLENEIQTLKTQKPKTRVHKPRRNDGVVRPRVYKW